MSEKVVRDAEATSKHKILDVVFSQIDKAYGKGSVMLLGQSAIAHIEVISTGSLLINSAIGVGGFPRGRVTEIYGPEASGKTTLALQAIAQAQKTGGICAFIDAEHALDPLYASKLGININDLIISQPDFGEQALDIAEMLIRSGVIDLIVIDSVAALVPKAEVDGDMGDPHMGLQARLMSQALRKLTPVVHKSRTSLIFINQIRQKINAMAFANNETTTGGNALKFYASLRIDVRRIESIKDKDGAHRGNVVRVKIAKKRWRHPLRPLKSACCLVRASVGNMTLDAGIKTGVVTQSGSWFSFNGEKLAQGRDQVIQALKADNQLINTLIERVRTELGLAALGVTAPDAEHASVGDE